MKVVYEVTAKFTVVQEIDTLRNCKELKSNDEFATDLCMMVCDEAVNVGVATYEILNSSIDVR